MHADLSRNTFRPERHYSAIIAQQGRVQLDADTNEQTLLQLYQHRVVLTDLIGQYGGPANALGFTIEQLPGPQGLEDLSIGPGRYYVSGILCDAHRPMPGIPVPDEYDAVASQDAITPPSEVWTYWEQPDGFRDPERPADRLPGEFPYLVYLKVWERAVTAAEDPTLREVALGSATPDTAARIKVVWQVLALPNSELGITIGDAPPDAIRYAFQEWADARSRPGCRLAARSKRPANADEPCLVRPDARYRGPENQLYRVEIHEGGSAAEATFKWSRDNGSVTFPIDEVDGSWVSVASLGNDDKLGLNVGELVEVVDTAYTSRLEPLPLLRVEELDLPERRVRLSAEPIVGHSPELHPFLRRWDQLEPNKAERPDTPVKPMRNGTLPIEEGRWLQLEHGVEVYFSPTEAGPNAYRTGDHWLIPARTATGDVEWPVDRASRPLLQAPSGIAVHYAPLAWVAGEQNVVDLRMEFGLMRE